MADEILARKHMKGKRTPPKPVVLDMYVVDSVYLYAGPTNKSLPLSTVAVAWSKAAAPRTRHSRPRGLLSAALHRRVLAKLGKIALAVPCL